VNSRNVVFLLLVLYYHKKITEEVRLMTTRKMLTAVDLSEISEPLVTYSHSIAHRLGIEVTYIHALPHTAIWRGYEPWIPPEMDAQVWEVARKKMAYYVRKAEESFPNEPEHKHEIIVKEGYPADVVIQTAKEGNYGLIVVGYKGHSTLERILVGSTGAAIARHAPCSVLIYRPGYEII
jgi:nucleotide-binding universal stress UspA family protein